MRGLVAIQSKIAECQVILMPRKKFLDIGVPCGTEPSGQVGPARARSSRLKILAPRLRIPSTASIHSERRAKLLLVTARYNGLLTQHYPHVSRPRDQLKCTWKANRRHHRSSDLHLAVCGNIQEQKHVMPIKGP